MTIEPSTWLRIEFISFYIVLVCCFFSRQVESSHLNESFYGLDCTHLRIRLMNDEHCYIFPEKRVRGKKIYNKKKQRKETEEKKQQFIWNQRREISIDLCSLNQVNAGGLDTFILIFLFIYFFLPISFFFRFVSFPLCSFLLVPRIFRVYRIFPLVFVKPFSVSMYRLSERLEKVLFITVFVSWQAEKDDSIDTVLYSQSESLQTSAPSRERKRTTTKQKYNKIKEMTNWNNSPKMVKLVESISSFERGKQKKKKKKKITGCM